jgi:hypothetical protein
LHELLAHWDELSDIDLARLQAFPEASAKLQRLRDAQAWLENSLLDQQACPGAEELFALALPFSGESLDADRRAEVQEHLKLCQDCAQEYQTLSVRPPAPLIVDPLDSAESEAPSDVPGPAPIPFRRLSSFAIAAAALLLVWLFAGRDWSSTSDSVRAAGGTWPETVTLRGADSTALLWPRGKQLARGTDPAWNGSLRWRPETDAQSYRVTIYQNDGSALDLGTERVNQSTTETSLTLSTPLGPGHYTAALFATVFGLESPSGFAEFQVVQAPEVLAHLATLGGVDRVRFLHDEGWWSDALLEARQLPEDPGRERYIRAMESR